MPRHWPACKFQHALLLQQSAARESMQKAGCVLAAAMRHALGIGLHGRWLHGQPLRSYDPSLRPCRRHELKAFVGLHGEAQEGEVGEVPLSLDEVPVRQGMAMQSSRSVASCTVGLGHWQGLLCRQLAPLHWHRCVSAAAHQPPESWLPAAIPLAWQVIQGALDMANETAEQAMTPIDHVRGACCCGSLRLGQVPVPPCRGRLCCSDSRSPAARADSRSPAAGGCSKCWAAELAANACMPHAWPSLCHLQVFMLSSDNEISDDLLQRVIVAGHSRVPVYAQNNKQAGWGSTAACGSGGAPCCRLLLPPGVLSCMQPGAGGAGQSVCSLRQPSWV